MCSFQIRRNLSESRRTPSRELTQNIFPTSRVKLKENGVGCQRSVGGGEIGGGSGIRREGKSRERE